VHYESIASLSAGIKSKSVSPVEVTRYMLARIAARDGTSGAYATLTAERATARAAAAEQEIEKGLWRGPLHGIPIGLKDLIYTDFAVTEAGTAIHRGFKPPFSATVTERLEAAGAITLGKLKTTEQAFADHHPSIPAPINPWGAEYWTGSSSSGSGVATAAGLAFGTLGSDTGGSIRLPSAANGITGLKPTWGRVSRYGVFPLADTLDHVGPMTRSAVDAAIMLEAIAGADPNDPTALHDPVPAYASLCEAGIRGLKIGLPRSFVMSGIDDQVAAAWEATSRSLERLGAVLYPMEFPEWREAVGHWGLLCAAETAWAHRDTHPSRKAEYGAVLSNFIEMGQSATAQQLAGANIARVTFQSRMAASFHGLDLILMPTLPSRVPTTAEWLGRAGGDFTEYLRFTIPADLTGGPTITFPASFDTDGMPITMQLYGPHLSEPLLCQAGAAFQRATDWHLRHPQD